MRWAGRDPLTCTWQWFHVIVNDKKINNYLVKRSLAVQIFLIWCTYNDFTYNNVYKWKYFAIITKELRSNLYYKRRQRSQRGFIPWKRGCGRNIPCKHSWIPAGKFFGHRDMDVEFWREISIPTLFLNTFFLAYWRSYGLWLAKILYFLASLEARKLVKIR